MPAREALNRDVMEALHKAQPGVFKGEGPKLAETVEAWMSTSMWLDPTREVRLPLAVSKSSVMLKIAGEELLPGQPPGSEPTNLGKHEGISLSNVLPFKLSTKQNV